MAIKFVPGRIPVEPQVWASYNYYFGIDTGVNTGFALWNRLTKRLEIVESYPIHTALLKVLDFHCMYPGQIMVRVEDARLRKWFGPRSDAKLQGAGSIKRDAKIWEDFLEDHNIAHIMLHPKDTKFKADYFKRLTGWQGVTNEHSRDAALLVFGK